jgi:hypothetical protein
MYELSYEILNVFHRQDAFMVMKNRILTFLLLVIFFLTGPAFADDMNRPFEPSYTRFRLTAEELNQLDEYFQKFHQMLEDFLDLNRQAEKQQPGLIVTEVGYIRLRHIGYYHEYPGYGEFTRFKNTLISDTWIKEYQKLYNDCMVPFAAKIAAEAVMDANWSKALKPAYLLKYRHTYGSLEDGRKDRQLKFRRRESLTAFNADEPNDDILWENIKKHIIETSKSYEQERENLLSQVPVYFAESAGYTKFASEMRIWTGAWIRLYAPGDIFQPLRGVYDNSSVLRRYYEIKEHLDKQNHRKYEELKKSLSWEEYQLFLEGKLERVTDDDYCQNKFLYELVRDLFIEFFVGD